MLKIKHIQGFSLIELVLAVVVLGVAFTGMMHAIQAMMRQNVSPIFEMQAVQLGQSYLEDLISRPFGTIKTAAWADLHAQESNNPSIQALHEQKFTMDMHVEEHAWGAVPKEDGKKITLTVKHDRLGVVGMDQDTMAVLVAYRSKRLGDTLSYILNDVVVGGV